MVHLTWLADELHAAGLPVLEVDGWTRRGRAGGTGYAPGRPWIVMIHHTASPSSWDGARDAHYIATGSPVAPVANLYLDRRGQVWVCAAGATNTNGKGRARAVSRGTIPADAMNLYAVGIECGNNGLGEAWPAVQIDALFTATIAVLDRLGLADHDVGVHEWYAPGRKIDPARADAVQGPWRPRAWNSAGTWDLDDIWAEITRRRASSPAPTPTPQEDDMPAVLLKARDGTAQQQGAVFWWDGRAIGWVRSPVQIDVGVITKLYAAGGPLTNFGAADLQRLIDSSWAGGPVPPGFKAPAAVDTAVT